MTLQLVVWKRKRALLPGTEQAVGNAAGHDARAKGPKTQASPGNESAGPSSSTDEGGRSGTPGHALREIARVLAPGGRFVHETPLAQRLAHPIRSSGRSLPWSAAPALRAHRHVLLFGCRVKE